MGRNKPGVLDQRGVRVEGEDIEKADSFGLGGLEIHERHCACPEFCLRRVQFESAKDLSPWGVVVLERPTVEDPR